MPDTFADNLDLLIMEWAEKGAIRNDVIDALSRAIDRLHDEWTAREDERLRHEHP